MTNFLIFITIALLGIAIWQLIKIFDLTQASNPKKDIGAESEIANEKDNDINGYLLFGFLGFLYIFTIYGIYKWGKFPLLTDAASEHGGQVDQLMCISLVLIFAVQFLTQFLLHYFAFKSRGVGNKKALFFADNDKLEAIWTIIPVITLSGLILYGLYAWNDIMYYDEEEEVMFVEVYAYQFGWVFRYSGDDNTLGKANVRYIKGINALGNDMSDPNSFDDKLSKELHLPVGKKVVFKMRSQDVLHSAYFPHFRAQMNCVPGMVTQFAMTPIVTTDEMRERENIIDRVKSVNEVRNLKSAELVKNGEEGLAPYQFEYLILCNKICGASHYNMQAKIVVEPVEDFRKWYSALPLIGDQVAAENEASKEEQKAINIKSKETPDVILDKSEVVVDSTAVVAKVAH